MLPGAATQPALIRDHLKICYASHQIHNTSPSSSGNTYIYGVEYEISGVNNHADDHNMPCALCLAVGRSTMVMIPSHYECPAGQYKEYSYIYLDSISHDSAG